METLSYFFIFFVRYSVKLGERFGGIHAFLGIKTWNTAVVFIETGGPTTGFTILPQKTRETAKTLAEFHWNRAKKKMRGFLLKQNVNVNEIEKS